MTTMRIKSSHPESQGDHVVIEEADFDPSLHEPFDASTEPESEDDATDVDAAPGGSSDERAPQRRGKRSSRQPEA